MWLLSGVAWATTPSPSEWQRRLLDDPAEAAAELRDPAGPLGSAFPIVRGSVDAAPVWALTVAVDPRAGTASFDAVLAFTAPADVDRIILRAPAVQLGGRIELDVVDSDETWDGDLVHVPRVVAKGETVALRVTGTTTARWNAVGAGLPRLFRTDGALVLAGWLPLPTPCDPSGRWDERPWTGSSDPGGHEAMVFLAAIQTPFPSPTLLHPGTVLAELPGSRIVAAVGVRELPIVALTGFGTTFSGGDPPLRVWSRPDADWAPEVARVARSALDDFTTRYGPLSSPRIDLVMAVAGRGLGVELPGLVLLGSGRPASRSRCMLVTHEIAHQWWYGEVGSDALLEPWVDEGLATWSALDHCRRTAPDTTEEEWNGYLEEGLAVRRGDRPAAEYEGSDIQAVYVRPALMLDDLGADGVDPLLARWLAEHRGGFATAAELIQLLEDARGKAAVEAAWAARMGWPAVSER